MPYRPKTEFIYSSEYPNQGCSNKGPNRSDPIWKAVFENRSDPNNSWRLESKKRSDMSKLTLIRAAVIFGVGTIFKPKFSSQVDKRRNSRMPMKFYEKKSRPTFSLPAPKNSPNPNQRASPRQKRNVLAY